MVAAERSRTEKAWTPGRNPVVLLGAGFSRAVSGGEMPLMNDFFGRLRRRRHKQLYDFLSDRYGSAEHANIEEALQEMNDLESAPFRDRSPTCRKWTDRMPEVRTQLGTYAIKRLSSASYSTCHWAARLLRTANSTTTVITTNYDNLAERILSNRHGVVHRSSRTNCHHCRMCRMLTHECECEPAKFRWSPTWQGCLLKLHGSVAWSMCRNPQCQQCGCIVPDSHCRPRDLWKCGCCSSRSEPVLVLPTRHKDFGEYPEIKRMWTAALHALSEAKSLLVFGFSFPASDSQITRMLAEAANERKTLRRIGVIDVDPEPVIQRIASCLPPTLCVDYHPLQVPSDGSMPAWLTCCHKLYH